uniref:Uncharacterized protein n=1 Tax=Caenorhabditis japonica TaxID=281687 RepID=A0A8R1EA75_CAEJA
MLPHHLLEEIHCAKVANWPKLAQLLREICVNIVPLLHLFLTFEISLNYCVNLARFSKFACSLWIVCLDSKRMQMEEDGEIGQ